MKTEEKLQISETKLNNPLNLYWFYAVLWAAVLFKNIALGGLYKTHN